MPQFRRYLIAAGTALYENLPADQRLTSVYEDLRRITDWFKAQGYDRVLMDVATDPTADELKKALGRWFKDRTAKDHVVFYYSGHGECIARDGHYLVCRDGEYREGELLAYSALGDEELAKAIAQSQVQHALIILDTCYSTAGLFDFSKKATDLFQGRHYDTDLPHGIHLIAAAREGQQAFQGTFSAAFCTALANKYGKLGDATQEFLRPEDVVGAVNKALPPSQVAQHLCPTPRAREWVTLLPNPRFHPGRPEGLTLAEHWLPSAQGGILDSRAWYFTGRERALGELVAWLSAPAGDGKARVVTGSAGCGKSALLARLVLLSDAGQRAAAEAAGVLTKTPAGTIPPLGCIDLRVHARGKTLAEVGSEIGAAVAAMSGLPGDIVTRLGGRATPFTLVVDALDEAKEPAKIVRELLRRLAALQPVRLLLGTRPDIVGQHGGRRFVGLGQTTVELDLDSPAYLGDSDLDEYFRRRLLAEEEPWRHTPYRGRNDLAGPVAKAAVARCGRLFLIARLVADQLIESDQPLDADEAASIAFPETVSEAFDAYLRRYDDDAEFSQAAAVDLLRPLAYAEGAGLPFGNVWPVLATMLAGREYLDQDIDGLKQRAGSFIIESLEDGRSVYRLYHEALAEYVRAGRNGAQDQRDITSALVALVPARGEDGRSWLNCDPYIRTHLAAHAASGRVLGDLVMDPLFLVAAEPRRLLRGIRDLGPNESAEVYASAFHNLQTADPAARLAYLELAAQQHGRVAFLNRSAKIDLARPWHLTWVNWSGTDTHREIDRLPGSVIGLLTCEYEGRTLGIVATHFVEELRDGTVRYSEVRAYDLADGTLRFTTGHLSFVTLTGIALSEANGEIIVVAAAAGGEILRWHAGNGEPRGEPLTIARDGMTIGSIEHLVTAVIGGHPCLGFAASATVPKGARPFILLDLWDLEMGRPIPRQPIRLKNTDVTGLALWSEAPTTLLVSGDSGRIRLWDLSNGILLKESEPMDRLNALVATAYDGELHIVIGVGEGIEVWSADDDGLKLAHQSRAGHAGGVTCLALQRLGDEAVFLSGGRDHVARVWRLRDSALLFETLVSFAGLPTQVALVRHHQRAEVLTTDRSGALLAWPLSEARVPGVTSERPLPDCGWVDGLNVVESGSAGWCVATHRRNGTVRAWQAATGAPWPGPLGAEVLDQAAMALGRVRGRLTLFTCDWEGVLVRSDEGGARQTLNRQMAGGKVAVWLALVQHRDADYLVSVDAEGGVVVQDVNTERIETQFQVHLPAPLPELQIQVLGGVAGPFLVILNPAGGSLLIWGLPGETRGLPRTLWAADSTHACACAMVAGRPLVLVAHEENGLSLWDLESGRRTESFSYWEPVIALALSEIDGQRYVACVDRNTCLQLWRGRERIASIQTDCTVKQLAFVAGLGIIVAGCEGMMLLRP